MMATSHECYFTNTFIMLPRSYLRFMDRFHSEHDGTLCQLACIMSKLCDAMYQCFVTTKQNNNATRLCVLTLEHHLFGCKHAPANLIVSFSESHHELCNFILLSALLWHYSDNCAPWMSREGGFACVRKLSSCPCSYVLQPKQSLS